MVQLVIVYCMISNASICTEKRPMFEQPISLMGCMTTGQQTAATYVDEHPQWRLVKFRCEIDVPRDARL